MRERCGNGGYARRAHVLLSRGFWGGKCAFHHPRFNNRAPRRMLGEVVRGPSRTGALGGLVAGSGISCWGHRGGFSGR